MELTAAARLVEYSISSPLLKPRVRISQRPLAPTLTSFPKRPIFPPNHRQLLTMSQDPQRPISCAASVDENGSTITASPFAAGNNKFWSYKFGFSVLVFETRRWVWVVVGCFSGARIGEVKRVTKETNVSVKVNLDGSGVAENNTGIPFLDHMLDVSDFGLKFWFNLIDFLILYLFLNLGLAVFSFRFPVSAFYLLMLLV